MKDRYTLVECQKADLGYENKIILHGIDFKVCEGDYICIVGENGSGKSTLLKSMLGLIKPIHGTIYYSDDMKKGKIGYLPQQTNAMKDFPATVTEVVLSGFLSQMKHRPFYRKDEKNEAFLNMEKLGILSLKEKSYRELSGGQQQRVLLARALCAAKKLLILDEPVTGLDPLAALELYAQLKALNQEENMAIIMVSHDLKNCMEQADKILHLSHKEYFFGSIAEYSESAYGSLFTGGIQVEQKTCSTIDLSACSKHADGCKNENYYGNV